MTGSCSALSLLSNLHPSRLFVSSTRYQCTTPLAQCLLHKTNASALEVSSLFSLGYAAFALSLRYGYYGGRQLHLGPNSSRMMKTSSLFVEQLRVAAGEAKHGLLLYGFNERPQLSVETNWTFSNHFFVDTYSRRGFSMWLNKGSRIWIEWKVAYGGESNADVLLVLIKGEKNIKELERNSTSPHIDLIQQSRNRSKAEHMIEEDNMYYLGVFNPTPRSIVMNMSIRVASRTYDTRKATSICSTSNGECKLKPPFPSTQYYVLATSNSEVPLKLWSIQLSFVARLTAYFVITVVIVVIVSMILKQIGACNCEQPAPEHAVAETAPAAETEPILQRKEMGCSAYGSTDEEKESSVCFSSQDLYDGKICVICYDQRRDCFFTPCGHCVTCCSCAQRIMQEENKICPICRRLIHKARRFPSP